MSLLVRRCLFRQRLFFQSKLKLSAMTSTSNKYFFSSIARSMIPKFAKDRFNSIINHKRLCSSTNNNNDNNDDNKEYDLTFLDEIFQTQWNTSSKIENHLRSDICYDVILLNAPGDVLIKKLCNHANTIICADGGANSLFRAGITGINIIPDAIVGDLDSVEQHILDYFINKGTKKILIQDQNDNDFHKSLKYLLDLNTNSKYVICWGAFGERFDHEMQGFNVLCKFKLFYDKLYPNKNIILMTGNNFAMVLNQGKHLIKCAKLQGPICSVIPLYNKTTVSTKGLKYDMNKHILQFGGLVSSSNGFINKQNTVQIQTDQMVVFHTSCNVKVDYDDWNW